MFTAHTSRVTLSMLRILLFSSFSGCSVGKPPVVFRVALKFSGFLIRVRGSILAIFEDKKI